MQNYIFKLFVKTVEAKSLNFCTMLKLVTLYLVQMIAQIKYASYSICACFVVVVGNSFYLLQKVEILDVDTLDCLLPETNWLFKDLFD